MTNKLCAVIFLFSLLVVCSCKTTNTNAKSNVDLDMKNNMDFDWDGVYTGTIPGADSSINVEITLKKDGTYSISYQYIDKSNDVFTYTGTFKWKENTIELDDNEIPPYYLVEKNTLTQLDMTGEKIGGEYANMYILKKE